MRDVTAVRHSMYTCDGSVTFSFLQDKILQSTGRGREVMVTNDGATILKSLHVDNPAAKVLIGIVPYRIGSKSLKPET